jgi:hypothetical protein
MGESTIEVAGVPQVPSSAASCCSHRALSCDPPPTLPRRIVVLCRGAWARVTIDQFRRLALRTDSSRRALSRGPWTTLRAMIRESIVYSVREAAVVSQ